MRRPLVCFSLLLFFAGLVVGQGKGPALAVGKDLPGTFHPYNVTARAAALAEPEPDGKDDKGAKPKKDEAPPTTKGKFHCLISEYNLEPVVMIFARGVEDNKAFGAALRRIDRAIEQQPALRVRCFVVFLDKSVEKVMENDDARDKMKDKVEAAFASRVPSQVVLTVAGTDDVKKYDLDATTPVTAVLYQKLRVKAIHKLNKDDLDKEDSAAINALLKDVQDKLGLRKLFDEEKAKGEKPKD